MELVIMAAGMGSRFGGMKQLEPIDNNGNFIIDYSIYDAIRCGFDKIIFIIKKENFELFRETIGKRVEKQIKTVYVFKTMTTSLQNTKSLQIESNLLERHMLSCVQKMLSNQTSQ